MTALATTAIRGFRGDLITEDHARYDEARAVWNGVIDRRPRLIARCTTTADIAAAVRFARDRHLEIAVRGGGHNVAGTAVCNGGIVIDLSAMHAVTVDPVTRVFTCGSSVLHVELATGLAPQRVQDGSIACSGSSSGGKSRAAAARTTRAALSVVTHDRLSR